MQISISAEELAKGLKRVKTVVAAKSSIPALTNVLFEADKDSGVVKFTGYDLETGMTSSHKAVVEEGGAIAIPSKVIMGISDSTKSGDVTIKADTVLCAVEVKSAGRSSRLRGIQSKEYPKIECAGGESFSNVDARSLLDVLTKAVVSASRDETRPTLCGVLLETPEKGVVRGVATDGHRLGMFDRKSDSTEFLLERGIILSRKGALAIKKLLEEGEGDVCEVQASKSVIVVRYCGTTVSTRIIDGEFPDYRSVMQDGFDGKVVVGSDSILDALKYAQAFQSSEGKMCKACLLFDSGRLEISSDSEACSGKSEIPVESFDGKKDECAVNASFLVDAVSSLGSEKVEISSTGCDGPVFLHPVGENVKDVAIVMPMRM